MKAARELRGHIQVRPGKGAASSGCEPRPGSRPPRAWYRALRWELVTGPALSRHERRRGAMVTGSADREGSVPKRPLWCRPMVSRCQQATAL
jgi:hypothetical protein